MSGFRYRTTYAAGVSGEGGTEEVDAEQTGHVGDGTVSFGCCGTLGRVVSGTAG